MLRRALVPLGMILATIPPAFGQFDSGSDGSFGPIFVPAGETVTLDLPPDGVFHATTVTVEETGTLKFNRNPLNTPVFLLATEDIVIEGTIDISGQSGTRSPPIGGDGGPGGFDGGMPGFGEDNPPGAGHGPGAGLGGDESGENQAGRGAYGTGGGAQNDGSPYGSPLLVPLAGGSGGGGTIGQPGTGGGGGGGAIVIASNSRVHIARSAFVLARISHRFR